MSLSPQIYFPCLLFDAFLFKVSLNIYYIAFSFVFKRPDSGFTEASTSVSTATSEPSKLSNVVAESLTKEEDALDDVDGFSDDIPFDVSFKPVAYTRAHAYVLVVKIGISCALKTAVSKTLVDVVLLINIVKDSVGNYLLSSKLLSFATKTLG